MREALFAVCSAVLIGSGIAFQQRAASQEDAHAVMDPRLLFRLFRRKTWLAGWALNMSGFGFQASAIATGRLVLVEPILSTNVLFALLMSARITHRRLGPREWWGILATVAGLGGFLAAANPQESADPSELVPWAVPLAAVAVAIVVGVLVARRVGPDRRALSLALLAGTTFGTTDALLKVFTERAGDEGVASLFGHWAIWSWFAFSAVAFLLQQSAFHASHIGAAAPGISSAQPIVAAGLGAAMFSEAIRGGWAIPLEVAFAGLLLVGVIRLASSPLIEVAEADPTGADPAESG